MSTNTQDAPIATYSMAPIAGPTTRETFMLTEFSEMAPARSFGGTSEGVTDRNTGPDSAAPMPTEATAASSTGSEKFSVRVIHAMAREPRSCSNDNQKISFLRLNMSAITPPSVAKTSWGTRLANPMRLTSHTLRVTE